MDEGTTCDVRGFGIVTQEVHPAKNIKSTGSWALVQLRDDRISVLYRSMKYLNLLPLDTQCILRA